MADGTETCPYCEVRVSHLERHIELKHEEFTLKKFLLASKATVITGVILLLAVSFILLGMHPVSVGGIHLHHILMALSIAVGGIPLAKEGLAALLKEHTFDVDSLVVMAALGAVAIGYWTEAGVLIFLFSLAETLQDYSVFSSRRTLRQLLDLSPSQARVRRDGETMEVPPEQVAVGETVLVKPGERIPIDGVIKKGMSTVNEAPITGESIPKDKKEGSTVYAGTLNINGALEIRSTRKSTDSTLSRIVRMVEEAEVGRGKTEQFVNRFATYYTPVVLALAALVFLIPPIVFSRPYQPWLYRALVLLVLSCPCAFVISTPITMLSAVTTAAGTGVLVKGGRFIENIKDSATVVFDKTGTLTTGAPEVTDIIFLNDRDERLLSIAAVLETHSEHPFAAPIIETCRQEGSDEEPEVTEFRSLDGIGVEGKVDNVLYRVGTPALFELGRKARKQVDHLSSQGKTVVVLGEERAAMMFLGIMDAIRPKAQETIAELRRRGLKTVMLTGDNETVAASVAEQLGIDAFRAELLPEDKVTAVKQLQGEGIVVMVGDGVNDAPALVASDVGIAMGAAGSDTAMESADMALMEDDLSKLLYLFDLSDHTVRVVKENIYSSIGVKSLLAGLAFFGVVTLWMAVGIGDMGLALLVVANALLLGRK